MELQIPGLEQVQNDIKELKAMVTALNPMNSEDKFIPRTKTLEEFDLSQSTVRNREQDGSLTPYKIGNRTYYKMSNIHSLLERSIRK